MYTTYNEYIYSFIHTLQIYIVYNTHNFVSGARAFHGLRSFDIYYARIVARAYFAGSTHGVQSLAKRIPSAGRSPVDRHAMPWVPGRGVWSSFGLRIQPIDDGCCCWCCCRWWPSRFAASRTDLVRYIVSLNLIGLFARKIGDLMIKRLFVRAFLGI